MDYHFSTGADFSRYRGGGIIMSYLLTIILTVIVTVIIIFGVLANR